MSLRCPAVAGCRWRIALLLGLLLGSAGCGRPADLPGAATQAVVPSSTATVAPPAAARATATAAPLLPSAPAARRAAAFSQIGLGAGFVNNFNHALVRTAADRLYVLVNDDNPARSGSAPGYLRLLRATTTGLPEAFVEQDAPHRPRSGGAASAISDATMAIDGGGLIHVLYHDRDGNGSGTPQIKYVTFDTASNTWGSPEVVAASVADYARGYGGVALSLDSAGVPHIVYADNPALRYRQRTGGQWSDPAQLNDTIREALHPALGHGPGDRLHLAWFARDGHQIRYRSRAADGQIDPASQIVVDYAQGRLNDVDQGPALTLTADGTLWIAYLDGQEYTRVRRLSGGVWQDAGPSADVYAHAPTIAAVGNDLWLLLGHDDQIDYAALHRPAGGSWGPPQTLEAGTFDGSANARWSWHFNGASPVLDTLFFHEGTGPIFEAQIFYRAIDTGLPLPATPTAGSATPTAGSTTPTPSSLPATATATNLAATTTATNLAATVTATNLAATATATNLAATGTATSAPSATPVDAAACQPSVQLSDAECVFLPLVWGPGLAEGGIDRVATAAASGGASWRWAWAGPRL